MHKTKNEGEKQLSSKYYEKGTRTMKKRNRLIRKTASLALSAALAVTMVPSFGISVSAEEQTEAGQAGAGQNDLRLWYTKPSSHGGASGENNIWQQYTLPIGDGDMGANVYGEISTERLTFNEKTLWTVGPSESRPEEDGAVPASDLPLPEQPAATVRCGGWRGGPSHRRRTAGLGAACSREPSAGLS